MAERGIFLVDLVHAPAPPALVMLAVVLKPRRIFGQQRVRRADLDHALEKYFVLVIDAVVVRGLHLDALRVESEVVVPRRQRRGRALVQLSIPSISLRCGLDSSDVLPVFELAKLDLAPVYDVVGKNVDSALHDESARVGFENSARGER